MIMTSSSAKLYASVDIGTNSTKMLVCQVDTQSGQYTPIIEKSVVCRLGEGSQDDKILKPGAIERTLKALEDFKKEIDRHQPLKTVVGATMCTREAMNQKDFISAVHERTGWKVRVLSGDEEAFISYKGARTLFPQQKVPIAAVDIGGGSTEWIVENNSGDVKVISLAMGAVRGTEQFLKIHPTPNGDVDRFREHTINQFKNLSNDLRPNSKALLIGIGGTVANIVEMICDISPAREDMISLEGLTALIAHVAPLTIEQRLQRFPHLERGRADVILAGTVILECAMRHFGFSHSAVSARGLRYGLLQEF